MQRDGIFRGVITTRDAERLETMLSGVHPAHGADLL